MSRTERSKPYKWWSKEDKSWRQITNRAWRRAGKHLLEDAPPQKSTQGWRTW